MESTMSEANYLRKQSKRAKVEMAAAVRGITKDAGKAANPRRLVQKHPWISLGTALFLGFAAARFIDRPRKTEPAVQSPAPGEADPERDRTRTIRKWIARAKLVASLLKPLIEGFLAVQAASSELRDEPEMSKQREMSREQKDAI